MTRWRDYFIELMERAVKDRPMDEWPEAIERVCPWEYIRQNGLTYRKWAQVKWRFIGERRKLTELQRAAGRRHAGQEGTV